MVLRRCPHGSIRDVVTGLPIALNVPICQLCGEREASHADHIIPWQRGGSKYGLDNGQAICQACHNRKTAMEGRR